MMKWHYINTISQPKPNQNNKTTKVIKRDNKTLCATYKSVTSNHVFIINTKVLLPQVYVTISDYFYPV
jgi:hypothetical protein